MLDQASCVGVDGISSYFAGVLDEISVYNRALQPPEIQAIYSAAGAGKSPIPPYFVTQPVSQQVYIGGNATFSVSAGGCVPMGYQWYGFKAGAIAGATNTTLALSNLQTTNADNYFAVASNQFGFTASAAAVLTVIDPSVDSNGDGLPDAWEMANFNTLNVNPNADPDGDGWSNLQEYLNGTNPNVADQPFIIIVTQPGGNSIIP